MEDDLSGAAAEPQITEDRGPKKELRPTRGRTFLPDVTGVEFSITRRGYDRAEVDQFVERVSTIVVELEAMRSPDAVIERALADVGQETSSILRRARKAAEEIIADAEAHARDRAADVEATALEQREEADRYSARVRADADAEVTRMRGDADRYRAQVGAQIEQLAQERHRLIEDLRGLADQFHRTADRALEQIPSNDLSYEDHTGNGGGAPTQAHSA